MTNNDCLRRIRDILDLDEPAMIKIFSLVDQQVTQEEISYLLKEDDASECTDLLFATFLNGLIIEKRGAKEGAKPTAEERLTNNIIFKKLRIAFDLQAEDILAVLSLADCTLSKHELSAFFRKPDSSKFRKCEDDVFEKVLAGLQIKYGSKSVGVL